MRWEIKIIISDHEIYINSTADVKQFGIFLKQ